MNRLVQGLLFGAGGVLAFFLTANVLEFYGNFGTTFRTVLFFSFLLFSGFILIRYIAIPLLKIAGVGKVLTQTQASSLIGMHFPEIKDKLLNTLQLQEQADGSGNEFLMASINQRIKNLSPFKFTTAIDLNRSFKSYIKYTAIPLMILLLILVFQSSMITKSSERLLSFNKEFVPEAPFKFYLKNQKLKVLRNSDYNIDVELKGEKIPATLFLELDGHLVKMENTGRNQFSYHLSNLTSAHSFKFTDGEFGSETYILEVLPNPTLVNFSVNLKYPSYTGRKDELLKNTGDFTVPEGTVVEWLLSTKDAESIGFSFEKESAAVSKEGDVFSVKAKIMESVSYSLRLMNRFVTSTDTIKYSIQTIPDRYPGIVAEQTLDSINPFIHYFYGKADDDYGLSKLQFVYRTTDGKQALRYLPVSIGKSTDEIFYYMVDMRNLSVEGSELEYYFEVWDNDAVNGKKSSKSQVFTSVAPSEKAMRKETESGNSSMKSKMAEMMKDIESLQKKGNEIRRELNEKNQLDWMQEQKLKDYVAEQKKLEKKMEQLRNENKQLNEKQKQLDPLDEELLKKQQELDKLISEIMTPEMKELMKKLEELVKKQNMEDIKQQLDKMKMSNEDMKKELDRSLEQFKQFELEKKLNEQMQALNKLAEEQKELSKKTEEKSESKEALKEQQDKLNQKFDELKKEINESEKKNEALETPLDLQDTKQEQQDIEQSMKESSENLESKNNKKATQNQKKAAQKMEELAAKMQKSLEKAQEKQNEEDYYTLRQILENLIELSVQQEDLMSQMKENRYYSPKYVELSSKQQKLKESIKTVEDSLHSLSKRQIHIKSYVNKELNNINQYMNMSIDDFSKVNAKDGIVHQQYVMTGLNNLAMMLSESLKQMQENMNEQKNQKKDGQKQCNNPGNKKGKSGKPKAGSLKQMQDQMNGELKQMMSNKKQGNNPNSEQYAKIAARQEAIRRELERLEKMLKEEGKKDALGDLEKTKQLMEQQERDLVNKQLTPETLRRMEEIETRMLEHEKAEREQDMDNTREAEQAKEVEKEMPPAIKAYLEKKAREMELIRSVPAELTPYYKDKVRVYFQKLGTNS